MQGRCRQGNTQVFIMMFRFKITNKYDTGDKFGLVQLWGFLYQNKQFKAN